MVSEAFDRRCRYTNNKIQTVTSPEFQLQVGCGNEYTWRLKNLIEWLRLVIHIDTGITPFTKTYIYWIVGKMCEMYFTTFLFMG